MQKTLSQLLIEEFEQQETQKAAEKLSEAREYFERREVDALAKITSIFPDRTWRIASNFGERTIYAVEFTGLVLRYEPGTQHHIDVKKSDWKVVIPCPVEGCSGAAEIAAWACLTEFVRTYAEAHRQAIAKILYEHRPALGLGHICGKKEQYDEET